MVESHRQEKDFEGEDHEAQFFVTIVVNNDISHNTM